MTKKRAISNPRQLRRLLASVWTELENNTITPDKAKAFSSVANSIARTFELEKENQILIGNRLDSYGAIAINVNGTKSPMLQEILNKLDDSNQVA